MQGSSFTICETSGDISDRGAEGLFVADTRICSKLVLTIDDAPVEPLAVASRSPFAASFVGRTADRAFLVFRDLWIGRGLRVDIRLRNLTDQAGVAQVCAWVGTDLADLFTVKAGRSGLSHVTRGARDGHLAFVTDDGERGLIVRGTDGLATAGDALRWRAAVAPRDEWATCLELSATRGGGEVIPRHRCGQPTHLAVPTARQEQWLRDLPDLRGDVFGLSRAFRRAGDDIGGLRLFDPQHPDEPVIAAGAPWYMTLFGRDSILTSWMALLLDSDLGAATARTLARLQGTRDVAETEEQPGRILHEVRFGRGPSLAFADGDVYYGTADAPALFVMLVHELWRWGRPLDELRPLLPAVEAALGWLDGPGDPDRDGYVEYARQSAHGLANQGWKDSADAVSFADGRLAEPPVALAEVQAYAYAAWRAGAALAAADGDPSTATARQERADKLRARFDRDFWLPEHAAYAIALDCHKRPVDAVASNMGHCLWAGIVADPDKAASVARWLVSPELFTGWGVRTLASSMARYNPLSYHNGSVWPHDTAICIAGLRRAGRGDEALQLAGGLLAAAETCDGRLPELFAGLARDEMPVPVPYPASCSPQAWASAAPLLVTRTLLGLEPNLPAGFVELDPALPPDASRLELVDLPLGGARINIGVDQGDLTVGGLPADCAVVRPAT
ncbi:MAG TPA: glycogen debranching N-terminal domain-containing protein [Acidimicrobiales bacterium]|nr:glycogen debranching N-terminal domain-containing protein [Acidimicrobiales bacterium]